MRLGYDPETDSAYIKFEPQPSTESFELCDGIVIDLDADKHVVGVEIEWASKKLDVEQLRATLEREAPAPPSVTRDSPGSPRPTLDELRALHSKRRATPQVGMDVKEAAALARSYFDSVYLDETMEGLRLEELKYDYDEDEWSITLGFTRADSQPRPGETAQHDGRIYIEIRIDDGTGKVIALRDRFAVTD